jgi:flavodoxin
MKKAVIIYQSKTGITKKYAAEIGQFLAEKGVNATILPVAEYKDGLTDDADMVFLGCWTAGLMLFLQHPEKTWNDFAHNLPELKGKKAVLFTTYKLATGSMFKNMRKHLGDKGTDLSLELKSRNGKLSPENKQVLTHLMN